MNRVGHENVEFFLGPEVELTPAHGKRTLFVVGYQEPEVVEAQAKTNRVTHVYLGANHSFDPEAVSKGNAGKSWNELVKYLLDRNYFVTIDYQAHMHDLVLPMFTAGVWQSRLFIPILSVRIPKIQNSSPNLTIKFDDIDFNATNEGVWCLNHSEVTDSNRFTPWQDYTSDEVLSAINTIEYRVVSEPERKVFSIDVGDMTPAAVATTLQTIKESTPAPQQVVTPVINDVDAGLDTSTTSLLRPEEGESIVPEVNTTPKDAADAYAAGAKADPLGKEASTKPKAKK